MEQHQGEVMAAGLSYYSEQNWLSNEFLILANATIIKGTTDQNILHILNILLSKLRQPNIHTLNN